MKPIAEQCAERGIEVPLGKTASEVRAMGLEVPAIIPGGAVLRERDGRGEENHGVFSGPTGYVWKPYEGLLAMPDRSAEEMLGLLVAPKKEME
jgi:hypothetical protein